MESVELERSKNLTAGGFRRSWSQNDFALNRTKIGFWIVMTYAAACLSLIAYAIFKLSTGSPELFAFLLMGLLLWTGGRALFLQNSRLNYVLPSFIFLGALATALNPPAPDDVSNPTQPIAIMLGFAVLALAAYVCLRAAPVEPTATES